MKIYNMNFLYCSFERCIEQNNIIVSEFTKEFQTPIFLAYISSLPIKTSLFIIDK
jgi:hypothetical protein